MDFNKVPRWMLVWGFMGFMSIVGITLKGAFADLDATKQTVAKHNLLIPQIMDDIKSIKSSNETFRVEYRQDQKDMNSTLGEIARAVKA